MRKDLALALLVASTWACGQVSFGTNVEPPADVGTDLGFVDLGVDGGVVPVLDTGETPMEVGCRPVTLPPADLPPAWPFESSLESYQETFLNWATDEGCTLCHSVRGDRGPPLIVSEDELGQYERSRDAVWSTFVGSEPKASDPNVLVSGTVWRHAVDRHTDPETSFPYNDEQIAFLEDFIYRAWACQLPAHFEPQDAGTSCGPPPPPPDAGPLPAVDAGDGGVLDAAPVPDTGPFTPCFCDQPDAGPYTLQYCVP